ncbi:MAG TPA: site-2 protease family protein [Nitrospirota bacterium]|nr:site-2 protease family protein [Nitrospirota bacterium]
MFGKRITLFKLLGFEVHIDPSWLIIVLLVVWSLTKGWFPSNYRDLAPTTYLWMGLCGAAGLFFSIVFHELCHSLVARRFGLPMRGITLFVFGGVAEMSDEPSSAKAEFLMAIAGPLSSIFLGLMLYVVTALGGEALSTPVIGVTDYLSKINLFLAMFNLLPAFPLDGGRVLRAALWQWRRNLRWATRIASSIGTGFGFFLILVGIFYVVVGRIINGIWLFMIGMFLRNAAQMSYQQVLIRKALEGETVQHFMKRDPVTAPSSISIKELVEDYIYNYHYKMYPVVEGGELIGCVTSRQVKDIPRDQWTIRTVGSVAIRYSPENTIDPAADALKALSVMSRTGNSRLMVVDEGRLVGIITLKDIMGFISIRLELDEYGK